MTYTLIGFNYDFNSLNPKGPPNELGEAFKEIFNIPDKIPMAFVLRNFFPVLKYIIVRYFILPCG